jgi:hypothetical protein
VWGGANNIAKNESEKGLIHLSNFVKQKKNTNIVIVNAPKRHDLSTTSCVNCKVITYNRKLQKRMKIFEYAKILDSEVQREHFTRHGLHINKVGKELMAQRLTDHIKKNLVSKEDTSNNLEMEARSHGQWSERSCDTSKSNTFKNIRKEKKATGNKR